MAVCTNLGYMRTDGISNQFRLMLFLIWSHVCNPKCANIHFEKRKKGLLNYPIDNKEANLMFVFWMIVSLTFQ